MLFRSVLAEGEKKFGKDNFTLVLVDTYNATLKKEISALSENIVFVDGNDFGNLPKGNIVTVHSSLKKVYGSGGAEILFVPANTQARIDAVLDCFNKATERVQGTTHTVRVR